MRPGALAAVAETLWFEGAVARKKVPVTVNLKERVASGKFSIA